MNSNFAVFCIDGSSITLTVLQKKSDNKQKIVHVSKMALDVANPNDIDMRLRNVGDVLTKIFNGFKKNRLFNVIKPGTEIHVLVGAPWHVGWNNDVVVEKDNHFKVTSKLVDECIVDSFTTEHQDLEITNVDIMAYRLNGYVKKIPIGKITKSLELSVYVSSAPRVFSDLVRSKVGEYLPHSKIIFSAYSIALYKSVLSTFNEPNCIMVIPENETAEIVLIRNGIIVSEASLPFGNAVLARNLFGAKSSSIKESLLKTKRFVEGALDIPDLESIGHKLDSMKKNFLGDFRDIVWKMGDTLILPGTIYVIGNNLATQYVFNWIKADDYIKNTFTVDEYKVMNVKGNVIIAQKEFNGLFHKKSTPLGVAVSTQFVVNK